MKIMYASLCVALLAASCHDKPKTAETTPLLKSDTTFVVGPELPLQNTVAAVQAPPEQEKPRSTPKKSTTTTKAKSQSSGTKPVEASNGSTQPSTQSTTEEAKTKKGWSKTAKGAVIGGVVGAGTGAVVNKKNRAAGAVIGGVIGAGAGAIIGNEMDKKDGRH
jgi:hypothetical protein